MSDAKARPLNGLNRILACLAQFQRLHVSFLRSISMICQQEGGIHARSHRQTMYNRQKFDENNATLYHFTSAVDEH